MTTRDQIRAWLQEGHALGATHVLVVTDTYDYEDYPIYVTAGESVAASIARSNGQDMQRVTEVYDLSKDWETQLLAPRAWSP